MQLFALFRLALASAPNLQFLTSLHNVTRRSVLQKVRNRALNHALSACKHRVSGSLSLPSRGSFHLSLTVLYAIGHWVVFRLGGWAPRLQTGFHVSGPTLDPLCIYSISPTGMLPSVFVLSKTVRLSKPCVISVLNPDSKLSVWPLSLSLAAT